MAREPDYVSKCGTVRLYCGDCLEILPTLEAGSVDAVVTDPPYGIGYRYINGKEVASTPEEYWEFLSPIWQHCLRIAKPGGFLAVWQTQLNFRHFWDWFGDNIHIYASAKNFVQLRKTPIQYAYDPVVMTFKDGADPVYPSVRPRSLDWYVANTANMLTRKDSKGHPCPRPLDAVIEVLVNFTCDGSTVLDSFLGSGTTGVACVKTGRRFIGIEKEPKYFEIAKRRIEEALNATPLLAGAA